MRSLKVWPTNAIPYLRNWDDPIRGLPSRALNDSLSIHLLAYQTWILRPANILILGHEAGQAADQALSLLARDNPLNPRLHRVPHSSSRSFYEQGPAILARLRQDLALA